MRRAFATVPISELSGGADEVDIAIVTPGWLDAPPTWIAMGTAAPAARVRCSYLSV